MAGLVPAEGLPLQVAIARRRLALRTPLLPPVSDEARSRFVADLTACILRAILYVIIYRVAFLIHINRKRTRPTRTVNKLVRPSAITHAPSRIVAVCFIVS